MSMQQRPLTQRQENFVRKVAEGMAASRAYRDAGFAASSGNSAEVLASRTLRKVQVAARLAELRAEQAKRHEVTIDSLARDPICMPFTSLSCARTLRRRDLPLALPCRERFQVFRVAGLAMRASMAELMHRAVRDPVALDPHPQRRLGQRQTVRISLDGRGS